MLSIHMVILSKPRPGIQLSNAHYSSPQCEYNFHSCRFHNPILLLAISLPEDDEDVLIPITPICDCAIEYEIFYVEGDIILEQVNSTIVMRLGNVKSSAEKIEYHETISASIAVSESASQTFIITKEELIGNENVNEKKSFESQELYYMQSQAIC